MQPNRKPDLRKLYQRARLSFESLELRQLMAAVSPDGLWSSLDSAARGPAGAVSYIRATTFESYALDAQGLSTRLSQAPMEQAQRGSTNDVTLTLPAPDGGFEEFLVFESPIMAPELAAQFPEIKTYAGYSLNNPAASIRFDVTPQGFHAQVLSPSGVWYIDPLYHLDTSVYASYSRASMTKPANDAFAEVQAPAATSNRAPTTPAPITIANSASRSGTQLRIYRAAVAASGEYVAFHGGTVSSGQAAVVTAMNRVSGIYETELSIRMQLVSNNSSLVYTNAAADPYSNFDAFALLDENQTNVDAVIGNANYDIGHVFTTGGGGIAGLGVVGISGQKALGVTGRGAPIGDAFWVDYVAHEMGHQFGGNHTFAGTAGACSGNGNFSTSYEPGSGSTIQGYAGICGIDDLQPNSDPYFHSVSFDEMIRHVDTVIPTVGTRTATGNSIPTVNAGSNYTIPAQTPFVLTATGSDANASDVLTYSWEQRDAGFRSLSQADNGSGPLFRAWSPTTDPSRTFPRLSNLVQNTLPIGEKLPTTTRSLNFRATVRDNRVTGGGVNTDDMLVSVVNTGAAFAVTAPNTNVNWIGSSAQTVTWNVAGTTANGINAANVRITLSTDGGLTYPIVLAASTPNDGSHSITVPNLSTTSARVRVQGAGNIFFDISNANFRITTAAPTNLAIAATSASKFEGNSGITPFTFTVTRSGNIAGATSVSYAVTGAGVNPASAADFAGSIFPSGVINFAASQTTRVITINVIGESTSELDERFRLTLSGASSGAIITDNSADGVIRNDDTGLAIAAASASRAEGNSGTTPFTFTVTRTGLTAGLTTVNYAVFGTTSSPATASDFFNGVLPRGTLTFTEGQTSKTITIFVRGDTLVEATERFRVNISGATGAVITTANANGAIINDDTPATLALAAADALQDLRKRQSSAALVDRALAQM